MAAVVSVTSSLLFLLWPEPKGYREFQTTPWFFGGFALLSISGSIVAGRLLSRRWYYLAMFWAAGALMLAFVIWH
jgi:hypothetical protein